MTGPAHEVGALLDALAHEHRVYVRSGRLPGDTPARPLTRRIAEEVHALVIGLYEDHWHRYTYGTGPVPVAQIEWSLHPKDPADAVALMARFAAADLLFPEYALMDRADAERIAGRVVGLLGPGARWWSNTDDVSSEGLVGCTLDGLVVGTDGERFAALIQVADD
ncbi:hypothetical protein [Streptomyces phaeofaciens]|uniref:hypothetical protein n=1 Tax=Streptomyces phaeofaciens TaxID=68254 RepID=UPI0036BAE5D4